MVSVRPSRRTFCSSRTKLQTQLLNLPQQHLNTGVINEYLRAPGPSEWSFLCTIERQQGPRDSTTLCFLTELENMTYQDKIFVALYQLNLSQLAVGAALEDLTAIILKIGQLEPGVATSLARHLSSVERNADRTTEAIFTLIQSRQGKKAYKTTTLIHRLENLTCSKTVKNNKTKF